MTKNLKSYKKILEEILEHDKNYTVVVGMSDVENGFFKNLKEEDFYKVIGQGNTESLVDTLNDSIFFGDKASGEYEFRVILKNVQHFDQSYYYPMEIMHVEYELLRTFKQRDRSDKLDSLLYDDFFDDFLK